MGARSTRSWAPSWPTPSCRRCSPPRCAVWGAWCGVVVVWGRVGTGALGWGAARRAARAPDSRLAPRSPAASSRTALPSTPSTPSHPHRTAARARLLHVPRGREDDGAQERPPVPLDARHARRPRPPPRPVHRQGRRRGARPCRPLWGAAAAAASLRHESERSMASRSQHRSSSASPAPPRRLFPRPCSGLSARWTCAASSPRLPTCTSPRSMSWRRRSRRRRPRASATERRRPAAAFRGG